MRRLMLAAMIGVAAMSIVAVEKANRRFEGPLKGADFVHFYTLGHLASGRNIASMFDMHALHDAQVALVPESTNFLYPAVYPPQVPVLFAPVSGWSFYTALLVWDVLSIAAYLLMVWRAWTPVSSVLSDRGVLVVAAVTFPPFWMLVLYGQISILIFAAFWAGWLALERGRPALAGAAFGLLAIKPQFAIPLAVVVLAQRDWAMLWGAVLSVALQAAGVWVMLGPDAFRGFASTLALTFNNVDLLESKPVYSHSLRTLTRLMPNAIGIPLWMLAAGTVLWYTTRVWMSRAPIRVRVGTVILASVLVNPHVIIYDAVVLALPLIWFAAYLREASRGAFAATYGKIVCWLFVALYLPTFVSIGLQVSVLLMLWLLALIARATLDDESEQLTLRAA